MSAPDNTTKGNTLLSFRNRAGKNCQIVFEREQNLLSNSCSMKVKKEREEKGKTILQGDSLSSWVHRGHFAFTNGAIRKVNSDEITNILKRHNGEGDLVSLVGQVKLDTVRRRSGKEGDNLSSDFFFLLSFLLLFFSSSSFFFILFLHGNCQ